MYVAIVASLSFLKLSNSILTNKKEEREGGREGD